MTERWAVWAMIGVPVAFVVVFGVIMGIKFEDPVLGLTITGAGVLSMGAIFGFAAGCVRLMTAKQRRVFEALAEATGGEVQRNIFGELRLVMTGPEGTAWIEWRAGSQAVAGVPLHDTWTRVRIDLPPAPPPGYRFDLHKALPAEIGDEAKRVIAAVKANLVPGSTVRLRGNEKRVRAEVWMPSYIDDEQVLVNVVAVMIPEIIRLSKMPDIKQQDQGTAGPNH